MLENHGNTGIDVSVSIRHRGSNWSQEWEFELPETRTPDIVRVAQRSGRR
jgi:hypothetical protein